MRYEFMSSCVSVELRCRGLCHTESHHEREGLGLRDNAGVCATAPEWRTGSLRLLSLHYMAARIVEVKGKWMA